MKTLLFSVRPLPHIIQRRYPLFQERAPPLT
jgi:hypothetical protein